MLPDVLRQKPLQDWEYSDLDLVIGSEESVGLELKSGLQVNRDAKGWQNSRKLHSSERDGLAKEIVAFANAYGGAIVIGVDESEEHPKRAVSLAEKLQDVEALVDQLKRSFASLIDPPLPGLEIRALKESADETAGYVAVRVPESLSKPHGFGTPSVAYVRKDDRSEPMKMREIQDRFFEAQTARQRLNETLDFFLLDSGPLYPFEDNTVAISLTLVPKSTLELRGLVSEFIGIDLNRALPKKRDSFPSLVKDLIVNARWQPSASGVVNTGNEHMNHRGKARCEIWDNGTINLNGLYRGQHASFSSSSDCPSDQLFAIEWVLSTVADLLGLAHFISKQFKAVSDYWFFQCSLRSAHDRFWIKVGDFHEDSVRFDFTEMVEIKPIRFHGIEDSEALELIEQKICNAFGVMSVKGERVIQYKDEKSI